MIGLLKRTMEILIGCFIASIPFTSLVLYELVESTKFNCYIIMCLSALAFLLINFYFFRAYFVFSRNMKLYLKVNITAYVIFITISMTTLVLCYYIDMPAIYTFLFLPLKVFMIFYKNAIYSALIYHVIMFGIIYIAPLTTNVERLVQMDDIDNRIISEEVEYLLDEKNE